MPKKILTPLDTKAGAKKRLKATKILGKKKFKKIKIVRVPGVTKGKAFVVVGTRR